MSTTSANINLIGLLATMDGSSKKKARPVTTVTVGVLPQSREEWTALCGLVHRNAPSLKAITLGRVADDDDAVSAYLSELFDPEKYPETAPSSRSSSPPLSRAAGTSR